MSEHYYTQRPQIASDKRIHETMLRGHKLRFATDAGVFSKTGIDYGSRVLIEAMDIPPGARVLDVGCGYGPIGISASLLNRSGTVTMIDVNERAVLLAKENAALNGAGNVQVLQSDVYEAVRGQQFDVIVTNPPIRAGKAVVHLILEEAFQLLAPGGAIWVVIQKKQGAPSAAAKLEEVFGNCKEVTKDKGYRILKAVKA
jgi:16S rRNA (guanine1207-N2)-methyltransferase